MIAVSVFIKTPRCIFNACCTHLRGFYILRRVAGLEPATWWLPIQKIFCCYRLLQDKLHLLYLLSYTLYMQDAFNRNNFTDYFIDICCMRLMWTRHIKQQISGLSWIVAVSAFLFQDTYSSELPPYYCCSYLTIL